MIELPGNDLQPGRTETFGLSPQGIGKVGDIRELTIGVHGAQRVLRSIELLANERPLFRRTYSPGLHLWTRYPRTTDSVTIPRAELRTLWTRRTSTSATRSCAGFRSRLQP